MQWQANGETEHENLRHEEPEGAIIPGPTSSVSASCGERFQRNTGDRGNAGNSNIPPSIPRQGSFENLQERVGASPMPPNVPLHIQTSSSSFPVETIHPTHGSASPGAPLLNTCDHKPRQVAEQPSFSMERWGDQSYGGGISGGRKVQDHLYVPPSSRRSTDHINYGIPPDEARFGLHASPRQSLPSSQQVTNYPMQGGGIASGAVQTTAIANEKPGVSSSASPQEPESSNVTSNVPKTRAQRRGASAAPQNTDTVERSAPQTRKRTASQGKRSQTKTSKRAKKTSS